MHVVRPGKKMSRRGAAQGVAWRGRTLTSPGPAIDGMNRGGIFREALVRRVLHRVRDGQRLPSEAWLQPVCGPLGIHWALLATMADAHLSAMREKMAAMAQMAEVASLQSQHVMHVPSIGYSPQPSHPLP